MLGLMLFQKKAHKRPIKTFSGKLTLPTGQQLTEDSLAPKIVLSNVFEVKHESIEVTTEAGQAPNLPEKQLFLFGWFTTRSDCQLVRSSSIFLSKEGTFTVVGRAQVSQCQLLPM